jgi:hypothetical protein
MDDALVARWRDGDAKATTAVRNATRSIAERVLSHPALADALGPQALMRLQSDERRRDITAEIAAEVMKRRADNAAQLTAMSLLVAGRYAVEAMHEGWPKTDEAHVPAQIAVSLALAPNGIAPRVKEAAERHLAGCKRCSDAIRVVDRIVKTQEAVDHDTEHEALIEEAARVEARLEAERSRRAERPRSKPRPAAPAPAPARKTHRDPPKKRLHPAFYAIGLVAVVGGGVWYARRGGGGSGAGLDRTVDGLAEIADRSPPEVGRLADLPPEVQFAVGDLANGDCRTAAGRFRSARQKVPDEPRLYVLEAGAQICAGDARKAGGALDDLDALVAEKGGELPRHTYWYRAQVALLRNEADAALLALGDTRLHDAKHRDQAAAQVRAIEAKLTE